MFPTRPSKRKIILLAIALPLLLALWLLYDNFIEDGNFHTVVPNTLYRSATLSHHEWKERSRESPFKSVLNLRGESPAEWYTRETTLSAQSGINFYTFPLSANHQPALETTEKLVDLMRAAPKPLLIHCKQGSDRTGLASALYAYAILGQPAPVAARQLSIAYGHFPWLTSRTGAMDSAFAAYVTAHPQPTANN